MRLRNFRCLVDVTIPIDDVTVLVGENNAGKTALLQALRTALSRFQQGRGSPFDEYDYHMAKAGDSPEVSEGITVELWFREDHPDEWPVRMTQALDPIIQTDLLSNLDSIGLRISCKYDGETKQSLARWEFLALSGEPLKGKGAQQSNTRDFLKYVQFYYLSALRDSDDEFSPRSQFWGRILRDLRVSDEQRKALRDKLVELNGALLRADPRLEEVRSTLESAQTILSLGSDQRTSIQALPLNHWDLMSKSQVVVSGKGSEVQFPLSRHGLGAQSLAVLFLFKAYIDVLLKPSFETETEAILALEEPEAHLHPHAIRALAQDVPDMSGQVLISTHSPYFIQEVPFKNIRLFRRQGATSRVLYVKRAFAAGVPSVPMLLEYCQNNAPKFAYDSVTSTLTVSGAVTETEYRALLGLFPGEAAIHAELKRLREESRLFISDEDLSDLNTYAKRSRGEVLFARAWLLCEGQSEYLLLRCFAEVTGQPLDRACVTVVDFQNNGSPGAFVRLARTFEMPWVMLCDHDDEYPKFVRQLEDCGLTAAQIAADVRPLPGEGMFSELYLCQNGFLDDYLTILEDAARARNPNSPTLVVASQNGRRISRELLKRGAGDLEIDIWENGSTTVIPSHDARFRELALDMVVSELKRDKVHYASALAEKLRASRADPSRVPSIFADAIRDVVTRAE